MARAPKRPHRCRIPDNGVWRPRVRIWTRPARMSLRTWCIDGRMSAFTSPFFLRSPAIESCRVQVSMYLDASQPCRNARIRTSPPDHRHQSRQPPRSIESRGYRSGREADRDRRQKMSVGHKSWSRSGTRCNPSVAENSASRRHASSRRSKELHKALDDELRQVQTFEYSNCRQTIVVLPKQKGKEGA